MKYILLFISLNFYKHIAGQQLALYNLALAVFLFNRLFHRNFDVENHILQIVVFNHIAKVGLN